MTIPIPLCLPFYLVYFRYSMQIRLNGKIWKSDEKLTHHSADKVFLHKSVCSSNSPFICATDGPSVRLSVRPYGHWPFWKILRFQTRKVLCHPHRMRGQIKSASSGGYSRVTTQSVYLQHSLSRQTSSNPVNFVLQVYASSCHMWIPSRFSKVKKVARKVVQWCVEGG